MGKKILDMDVIDLSFFVKKKTCRIHIIQQVLLSSLIKKHNHSCQEDNQRLFFARLSN